MAGVYKDYFASITVYWIKFAAALCLLGASIIGKEVKRASLNSFFSDSRSAQEYRIHYNGLDGYRIAGVLKQMRLHCYCALVMCAPAVVTVECSLCDCFEVALKSEMATG